MPNDTTGVRYTSLLSNFNLHAATRTPLTRGLNLLAKHVGAGLTTESTAAVGYMNNRLYVAKLGKVKPPAEYIEQITTLFHAPLDGETKEILSVFNDGTPYAIQDIVGVGGGMTGLHAEMMIIKHWGGMDAWGANFYFGVAIAASQGACPACAGFMNLKNIWHSGVRTNGRVSSRWINPIDGTVCGTEIGIGLSFPDRNVTANYRWGD
jgi:hypothetical protein